MRGTPKLTVRDTHGAGFTTTLEESFVPQPAAYTKRMLAVGQVLGLPFMRVKSAACAYHLGAMEKEGYCCITYTIDRSILHPYFPMRSERRYFLLASILVLRENEAT